MASAPSTAGAGEPNAVAVGLTTRERLDRYIALLGPMAMIAALLLLMAILEPARYFRLSNFDIILKEAALYMPMAMAMTLVICTRGIDLSIGSVAALTAIIMAYMVKSFGFPWWVAVPLAISLGALCGLVNGLIITRLKVPDLIGTLAMDLAYRGFALVLAKGVVLSRFPEEIVAIGRGEIPGFVAIPVVIGRDHPADRLRDLHPHAARALCARHRFEPRGRRAHRHSGRSLQDLRLRTDGRDGGARRGDARRQAQRRASDLRAVLQPARHRRGRGRRHVPLRRPRLDRRLARGCPACSR